MLSLVRGSRLPMRPSFSSASGASEEKADEGYNESQSSGPQQVVRSHQFAVSTEFPLMEIRIDGFIVPNVPRKYAL